MSFGDRLVQIFYALETFVGSKKNVDKINKKNILRAKRSGEEVTFLLHGVAATYYGAMYAMLKWFTRRGVCMVSLSYDDAWRIEKSAEHVKDQVESILKEVGVKKCNMVGVSLGGLVARYYIEMFGGKKRVDRLVTVYTPFRKVERKMGLFLNRMVGGRPEVYNKATDKIKKKFSVKNHLALYGEKDNIIGRQYPIKGLPKHVVQSPVKGGHLFVSYNLCAMRATLDYIKQ